mmetsp:Transcript_84248/g.247115  ORF Transcript_84248/g.247115 Transcript_84248/m.247115 type:complete len:206 (+) Transcript_84248:1216-1833(+)
MTMATRPKPDIPTEPARLAQAMHSPVALVEPVRPPATIPAPPPAAAAAAGAALHLQRVRGADLRRQPSEEGRAHARRELPDVDRLAEGRVPLREVREAATGAQDAGAQLPPQLGLFYWRQQPQASRGGRVLLRRQLERGRQSGQRQEAPLPRPAEDHGQVGADPAPRVHPLLERQDAARRLLHAARGHRRAAARGRKPPSRGVWL